ncbi:MAG: beta-galactosidase [Chloroflexi bacterium]|nr:beta-galactosidase [Chloroflexota bacterium]
MTTQPRPEHPQPQMVRAEWLNLNGPWQFDFDPGCSGVERGLLNADRLPREIVVPFCPESALSGLADVDFHPGVVYRRTFRVPGEWRGGRVLLRFGAVDQEAQVYVNGALVGQHRGGYTPFCCDITRHVTQGDNTVMVFVRDDTRAAVQATGKQSRLFHSHGCDYTRTTGIWQTVWLEHVPETYISSLRLTPDLPGGQVTIEAVVAGGCSRGTLAASASLAGKPMGQTTVRYTGQRAVATLALAEVEAWSPQSPTLYDLALTLTSEDGGRDEVQSYFGLRSVALSDRAILLNDRPVFQRLILDQGFYPDGIYTAPTDDALRRDIELSQAMGFNGARLHMKVFDPRFHYWADRMGYLVWGEFPNWGLTLKNPEALADMLPQWLEAVRRDYSHPSVVGWCPFNETSTDQDPRTVGTVYRVTKQLDLTRPVIDTSGYVHVETDIYDSHNYDQNPETFAAAFAALAEGGEPFRNFPRYDAPYAGEPYFVSEYGGIWWNPGQQEDKSWGYGGVSGRPQTIDEFYARYRALTTTLLRHPRMCAFCYTQLTDVEQEVNGLYTYARGKKFDESVIRAINTQVAAIEE